MTALSGDSEAPASNQQAITACAFIHQEFDGTPKVFLPKRADSKKLFPGVFELPGGHIEFGEDPVSGLKRELDEELGADIAIGDPFYVFTYSNPVKGSHSIEVVYFAKFISRPEDIKLNPEDHSDYGWFAENELEKAASSNKSLDNLEFQAMFKGFALLKGRPLKF